jgi:hypothetical protein
MIDKLIIWLSRHKKLHALYYRCTFAEWCGIILLISWSLYASI